VRCFGQNFNLKIDKKREKLLDLSSLNEEQRHAVECAQGPLLVLAGAGSGKTRVLTYRIAHVIENGCDPWNILAVTFTNKAAKEMRTRLEDLVPFSTRGIWINTFHSMCVRILRSEAGVLGFTSNFTIYDTDDSKRLIKQIMQEQGLSTKTVPDAAVRSRISSAKNELLSPSEYALRAGDFFDKKVSAIYEAYNKRLQRANAMDFDDLLYYTYVLFRDNSDIAHEYADKFKYILVDEYQDTNRAQYEITKMLAQVHRNIMVVGDDDQSIYSWRGADIRNILDFERDWPDAQTIKLEENYRSSGTILDIANALIAHNSARKAKHMFTSKGKGEHAALYLASDERDEGRWIASEIENLHRKGTSYNDIAVFYRTNAQSRILEDMFLRAGLPYTIVGGTRFFERAEIRDVMAYLKLVTNNADDVSAMRIINTPTRGIGKTSIDYIAQLANERNLSFFDAAKLAREDANLRMAARNALISFVQLIEEAQSYSGDLYSVVDMIVERTGIVAALDKKRSEENISRKENIAEFMGVVREFVETHEYIEVENSDEVREPQLPDFMEWLSLRTDLDTLDTANGEMITFMTIHSAKGLEFDYVFVTGMEEGIFPHTNSIQEHNVEEERRLAYVAITRARKKLYITHAQTRRTFNSSQANPRSRFVDEIPKELIDHEGIGSRGMKGTGWEKRGDRRGTYGSGNGQDMYSGQVFGKTGRSSSADNSPRKASANIDFAAGDKVEHKTFGTGVVLESAGDRIVVRFDRSGQTKKLMKGYAPLVKI
jgi:DNA helicase II / ATP-dependent DNA helicase PcrA